MIKVSKLVYLAAFLGVATIDCTVCSVRPRSDSQEETALPFMSLTVPVSSIPLTKKFPQKVDTFKSLTLKGCLAKDTPIDKVITQICARVNCDNIACLTLNECNWSLASRILPHFKNLEKLIILGHQEQGPLDTEKAEIIDSVCKLLDNHTLTELIMWGADINDDDAKVIFDRITPDNPLKILDFSFNNLTEENTDWVSDFLRRNPSLCILDLRNNQIEDAGALKILEAKDYSPLGTQVVLSGNPIEGPSLRDYFQLSDDSADEEESLSSDDEIFLSKNL